MPLRSTRRNKYRFFGPIPARTPPVGLSAMVRRATLPRPLPNLVPCVSLSHFTTLDPHAAHYSPPPPASRAATARIANSYAAKVMADAGALFTSPGANPL